MTQSAFLAPIGNDAPFMGSNGLPLSGGTINFYLAGTSTPQNTWTDSTATVANANPVVLNSSGYPASAGTVIEIWFSAGVTYKAILKDSLGVTIWTRDNLAGVDDGTSLLSEWIQGPTPTFISTTSFSLVGDQTGTFKIGRRLRFTVTAGTVYGTITNSVFGATTTVTVQMDGAQVLDSGLSSVFYSILAPDYQSLPLRVAVSSGTDTYTATVGLVQYNLRDEYRIKIANVNLTTTPTLNLDGLGAKTIVRPDGTAVLAGDLNGEHTFRYNGTNMVVLNPVFRTSTAGGVGSLVFLYRNFK